MTLLEWIVVTILLLLTVTTVVTYGNAYFTTKQYPKSLTYVWGIAFPLSVLNFIRSLTGWSQYPNNPYLTSVLLYLDLAGNAFGGGNRDVTVSARLGYLNNLPIIDNLEGKKTNPWLSLCRSLVDYTFYPRDGHNHCWKAYQWTLTVPHIQTDIKNGDFHINTGPTSMLFLLTLVVIVGCIFLILPLKLIGYFSKRKTS